MLQIGTSPTLVADYVVYFSDDPAIDKSVDGFNEIWQEYVRTGDTSKLTMKPGQEPTRWKLRHLRGKTKRMIQDMIRKTMVDDMISPTAVFLACQVALLDVENIVDGSGREFSLATTFDKELKIDVVSDEAMIQLDSIRDSEGNEGALVNELGLRAILSLTPDPL